MIKINGQIRLERDYVGEFKGIDKREIARACRRFFKSRGMLEELDMKHIIHSHAKARQHQKRRYKEEFDDESEQDTAENWL